MPHVRTSVHGLKMRAKPFKCSCSVGKETNSVPQGRLRVRLVQISLFFDSVHPPPLLPRWVTALNFVIPTGGPGFPISRCRPRRRMRLSLRKATRNSPTPLTWTGNPGERKGGTCSFAWTARKCRAGGPQPNPILFDTHAPPHNQRITCTPCQVHSLIWATLSNSQPSLRD